jgi:hypothetical protein
MDVYPSTCVGLDLEVYCARHREELHWRNWDAPKYACDPPSRGAYGVPQDLSERTIAYEWNREFGSSVVDFAWVVRATTLISAFLQRHEGCTLPLVCDFDEGDVHEAYLAAMYGRNADGSRRHSSLDGPPNWREYYLHDDVALQHIDAQRFDGAPMDPEMDGLVAPATSDGAAKQRADLIVSYHRALRAIPWWERTKFTDERRSTTVDLEGSMQADPFQAP